MFAKISSPTVISQIKKVLLSAVLVVVLFGILPSPRVKAAADNCTYIRQNMNTTWKECPVNASSGYRYISLDGYGNFKLWGVYAYAADGRYEYLKNLSGVLFMYDIPWGTYYYWNGNNWIKLNLPIG